MSIEKIAEDITLRATLLRIKHMAMMDDRKADWQSEAMHQNKLLHDALTRAQTAEVKLAKAVEALENLADCVDDGCFCSEMRIGASMDKARATLAEIKEETK